MIHPMLERMARAFEPKLWANIDEDLHPGGALERAASRARADSLKRAKAALEATREPITKLITDGGDEVGSSEIADAFNRYIDAILAEEV